MLFPRQGPRDRIWHFVLFILPVWFLLSEPTEVLSPCWCTCLGFGLNGTQVKGICVQACALQTLTATKTLNFLENIYVSFSSTSKDKELWTGSGKKWSWDSQYHHCTMEQASCGNRLGQKFTSWRGATSVFCLYVTFYFLPSSLPSLNF